MRQRVIDRVESGGSRREAAEHYEVSASTAVIWVKCFRETGRRTAKPRGGSTSPLEKHADFLLALIEVEPDLTLDEVVCAMHNRLGPLPVAITTVTQVRHIPSAKGFRYLALAGLFFTIWTPQPGGMTERPYRCKV
jgi:hypothetical protein